jgi:hypothetical protein
LPGIPRTSTAAHTRCNAATATHSATPHSITQHYTLCHGMVSQALPPAANACHR